MANIQNLTPMRPGETLNRKGGNKKQTLRAQLKRILRESGDDEEFLRSWIDMAIGRKKPNLGQFPYLKEILDRVDGPVDNKVEVSLVPPKPLDQMSDAEFEAYGAQLGIEGPSYEDS